MMDNDNLLFTKLRILALEWEAKAMEMVPLEYASRDLHFKYLNGDNEAAGIYSCSQELLETIREHSNCKRGKNA